MISGFRHGVLGINVIFVIASGLADGFGGGKGMRGKKKRSCMDACCCFDCKLIQHEQLRATKYSNTSPGFIDILTHQCIDHE
jgi:hypothetical protein